MKNKKELGQHWLKNREILEEIAELARSGAHDECANRGGAGVADGVDMADTVDVVDGVADAERNLGTCLKKSALCVEIGPGLGFLTSSLLRRFEKVVAIEVDGDLAAKLPGQFPGKNLEVVHEDFLDYDLGWLQGRYTVCGNIPYYITSPIIEKVLEVGQLPERVVLLVQREVAERILKGKGSVLALMVANRARVQAGPVVKAAEFTPPPEVDSQVIVLEPHAPGVSEEVMRLARQGFRAPRKKLVNNLESGWPREVVKQVLTEVGLGVNVRAGDLSLEDWQKLKSVL